MATTAAVSKKPVLESSLWNAIPHFLPITVFPLIFAAAIYGGWWLLLPFVFFGIVGPLDLAFGNETRNMDPKTTSKERLIWYSIPVWSWALLWPVTFVFTLWQIFMGGHLVWWESALLAFILAVEGQAIFIVGHELIHRRAPWERYIGEFLLASGSYPHYATEHFYIHHAYAGTPMDVGSAPKGLTFWRYFPRELVNNLRHSWILVRKRLARRKLPIWHYSNPFWRYSTEMAACYLFVFFVGGWWSVLIYMILCLGIVMSMKISNYIQHYGLRRIRLPHGRFETVKPHHAWTASQRFSGWMFFNMQRHADHHMTASRIYPLLQYYDETESPQLPGSYGKMFNLAVRPKRWFETMDPLVDQWRARFYPEIEDWSAYDSEISETYPEAFDTIVEIFESSPRMAKAIEKQPYLLESLQSQEYTDLEVPKGYSQDSEMERIAQSGLVRVYWTYEFAVAEMKQQLNEVPAQDSADAAEIIRFWMNDKVFQIVMHTIRGYLSPLEAQVAFSNVAEASVASILSAVVEDSVDRFYQSDEGAIAAIALGDLATKAVVPGAQVEIVYLCENALEDSHRDLCNRFHEAIRILTQDNLLFAPLSDDRQGPQIFAFEEFVSQNRATRSTRDLLDLARARCIFTRNGSGFEQRFDQARRDILLKGSTYDSLLAQLSATTATAAESDLSVGLITEQKLEQIERAARYLQLKHISSMPEDLDSCSAMAILKTIKSKDLIPDTVAEQLIEATQLWQNLRGINRVVLDEGTDVENATGSVKKTVAKACKSTDFATLNETVQNTVVTTESALAAVFGQSA